MTKKLYIFSGLGADERVFQRLNFDGFSTTFIKWTVPNDSDTIEKYANSLLSQITSTNPILIGLSFGGIVAVEVAKLIDTDKVILIASAKNKMEIPFYFRLAGKLRLHKLLPPSLLKKPNPLANWLFGATGKFEKDLLAKVLIDTNPLFLKWAIDKVVSWTNTNQTKDVFHIHGTNDKILPIHFVNCDYKISDGGHLMTLNKAQELTEVIRAVCETREKNWV